MNVEAVIADLITALDLPAGARVDQRVPKKLLIENGAPTAADKRAISDGVEELLWLAALKPNTIGVPEYRDEVREYMEVAVLHLTLRPGAKVARAVALAHRAIPYPVLLLTAHSGAAGVSAAHKRWSRVEAGKTVLDGDIVEANVGTVENGVLSAPFRDALAINRQPRASLFALYQGWIDKLHAFQAACKTGRFAPLDSPESAAARREALAQYTRLESETVRLRAAAGRAKQVARQVELNLELKRIEAELAAAQARL